uniref:Protein kinase domain-containing protein n=1 Tax=Salix viminalis TaxID=40686 RepID=A0A6N2KFE1_SALVM
MTINNNKDRIVQFRTWKHKARIQERGGRECLETSRNSRNLLSSVVTLWKTSQRKVITTFRNTFPSHSSLLVSSLSLTLTGHHYKPSSSPPSPAKSLVSFLSAPDPQLISSTLLLVCLSRPSSVPHLSVPHLCSRQPNSLFPKPSTSPSRLSPPLASLSVPDTLSPVASLSPEVPSPLASLSPEVPLLLRISPPSATHSKKTRYSLCISIFEIAEKSALPSDKPKSHKIAVAFGLSVGSVSVFILVFGLYLWWRQRHNQPTFFDVKDRQHEEVTLGNLRRFQFRELQISTNNFSNKNILGKGGFGNVYKGILHDGTVVAVKRLKDGNAIGGEIQFQTEVEMISLAKMV